MREYASPPSERHLAELGPGDSVRIGVLEASVSRGGVLEACDPYGCIKVRLAADKRVYLDPAPPLHRPSSVCSCLYIGFEEPVLVGERTSTLWAYAPYDVAVHVGDTILGYLSPFRVKFTLVGGLIDGVICRHYSSRAYGEPPDPGGPVPGLLRIDVSGVEGLVPGVGIGVAASHFYTDARGRVYYPLVVARREPKHVSAKIEPRPPLEGLEELWRPGRRTRLVVSLPAFITPIGE